MIYCPTNVYEFYFLYHCKNWLYFHSYPVTEVLVTVLWSRKLCLHYLEDARKSRVNGSTYSKFKLNLIYTRKLIVSYLCFRSHYITKHKKSRHESSKSIRQTQEGQRWVSWILLCCYSLYCYRFAQGPVAKKSCVWDFAAPTIFITEDAKQLGVSSFFSPYS